MERTRQALEGLMYYDEASAVRPVEATPIEKEDIPRFIVCPAYERARERIERSMECYTARVTQTEDRLRQSKGNIADLESATEEWSRQAKGVSAFNTITLDRSSASSVDRYNRDVARHNDAVREAEDRQEELRLEALREIDEDLVSFFREMLRCNRGPQRERLARRHRRRRGGFLPGPQAAQCL